MIDSRKTFVIGISVIFGLSVDFAPEMYRNVHPWIQPIFSSSLSLSTICAICLNLFFRIGIAKSATLKLTPGVDPSDKIYQFMDQRGRLWGARGEVIGKAMGAMNEFFEAASESGLTREPIAMTVRFDEFNLDVEVTYRGAPIELPVVRPGAQEMLTDDQAPLRLAGYMIRSMSDRAEILSAGDRTSIQLHFVH
jgi:NCS2 family nucleobase:cation symporter-2